MQLTPFFQQEANTKVLDAHAGVVPEHIRRPHVFGLAGGGRLCTSTVIMVEDRASGKVEANGFTQGRVQIMPTVGQEEPVVEVTEARSTRNFPPHVSDPSVSKQVA